MDTLLLLILLSVALLLLIVWRSKRRRERAAESVRRQQAPRKADPFAPEPPLRGNDPMTDIEIGGMVELLGVNYAVRGVISCNQEGFRWSEYMLEGNGDIVYLTVEKDPDLEVVLWRRVDHDGSRPNRGLELVVNGQIYEFDEEGRAAFSSEGTTGVADYGVVSFVDYVGKRNDTRRLSYERFGDDASWELSEGMVVDHTSMTIYPPTKPAA